MSRRVQLEYGDGSMEVELPDSAVVVDPGPHPGDPDPLADPVQATADAIDAPLGMPPLGDLVGPGSTVVIAFPDRVKGGTHETAHRRVSIPLLIDRLTAAGVAERDISLVCAIGLHRKNTRDEFREYLGSEIVDRFPEERLVNHDPEDPDGIVSLGTTAHGDVVEVNRTVAEADLAIMIGHSQGTPTAATAGATRCPAPVSPPGARSGVTTRRARCTATTSSRHPTAATSAASSPILARRSRRR